ncbi:hypothetical protein ABZ484_20700 [Streptomyces sp. NPDC006393]
MTNDTEDADAEAEDAETEDAETEDGEAEDGDTGVRDGLVTPDGADGPDG